VTSPGRLFQLCMAGDGSFFKLSLWIVYICCSTYSLDPITWIVDADLVDVVIVVVIVN
jgi:hypothetical protein